MPVVYYNRLPRRCDVDVAYVLDPLIATSNTVTSVVGMLKKVRRACVRAWLLRSLVWGVFMGVVFFCERWKEMRITFLSRPLSSLSLSIRDDGDRRPEDPERFTSPRTHTRRHFSLSLSLTHTPFRSLVRMSPSHIIYPRDRRPRRASRTVGGARNTRPVRHRVQAGIGRTPQGPPGRTRHTREDRRRVERRRAGGRPAGVGRRGGPALRDGREWGGGGGGGVRRGGRSRPR
jgi:hypothetical protein